MRRFGYKVIVSNGLIKYMSCEINFIIKNIIRLFNFYNNFIHSLGSNQLLLRL